MKKIKQDNNLYYRYKAVIDKSMDSTWNCYYQYGYEVIGILLYGFCTWLHSQFCEGGYEKIFFLSRDGYLMQKAYNMIYGDKAIENSYLYVSRNSLFMSQLWMNPSLENVLESETPFHYWDYRELCELLHVGLNTGREKWLSCGIGIEERFLKQQLLEDKRVLRFYDEIKDNIIALSREKYNVAMEYLEHEGFNSKVAIVDIGWAGAIQKYLQDMFKDKDIHIYGYYLGMKQKTVMGDNAKAYIPKEENPSLFCSQLVEYPFTCCVGSTISYIKNEDGVVVPKLGKYEFQDTLEEEYTKLMQAGALECVNLLKNNFGIEKLNYNDAYCNLKRVTRNPSLSQVKTFGNLSYFNHEILGKLASTRSIFYYIVHLKELKVDFSMSGWKVGFLKKLFKLPLPYYNFLILLRKLLEKEK